MENDAGPWLFMPAELYRHMFIVGEFNTMEICQLSLVQMRSFFTYIQVCKYLYQIIVGNSDSSNPLWFVLLIRDHNLAVDRLNAFALQKMNMRSLYISYGECFVVLRSAGIALG
jgi:hypothetical protein